MLNGKVVVVPIGTQAAAVARRLAAEGATVILVADQQAAAEAGRLAAEIESTSPGRPAVFAASSADELDGLVEFLTELFRAGSP